MTVKNPTSDLSDVFTYVQPVLREICDRVVISQTISPDRYKKELIEMITAKRPRTQHQTSLTVSTANGGPTL